MAAAANRMSPPAPARGWFVGAYAALTGSPAADRELYARLAQEPLVRGLEVPFFDDGADFTGRAPDPEGRWDYVLTSFPHSMLGQQRPEPLGLAARSPQARGEALAALRRLRELAARLDDRSGRAAVTLVEVHSGPQATGDPRCFAESLAELAGWDWGGARLTVEHCDAWPGIGKAQKGFLGLDAELEAIASAAPSIGVTINWARSVIETGAVEGAATQLRRAAGAGRLAMLVFSGVAPVDTAYGPAWVDAHLPPALSRLREQPWFAPACLLDDAAVLAALRAADERTELAVKVGLRPAELSAAARGQALVDLVTHQQSLRAEPAVPPADHPS